MTAWRRLPMTETSQTSDARQIASLMARSIGFSETDVGRVALVVSEASTNILKHAGRGEMLLRATSEDGSASIDVLALDRGPGIKDVQQAMRDGFTLGGGLGLGLGSIRRLATMMDIYTQYSEGVALLARVSNAPTAPSGWVNVDGVTTPHPHENVSGDHWAARITNDQFSIAVADGLGHGPLAARAAHEAITEFQRHPELAPVAMLEHLDRALRSTRGAAVGITVVDRATRKLSFAGIGNISATILAARQSRKPVSLNGIVGAGIRKIQPFDYDWPAGAILVLQSDGIAGHWDLERYPGLAMRSPLLIAAVLYRDFNRGRDDASVVVAVDRAERPPA